jgi:hypothetical protein
LFDTSPWPALQPNLSMSNPELGNLPATSYAHKRADMRISGGGTNQIRGGLRNYNANARLSIAEVNLQNLTYNTVSDTRFERQVCEGGIP